MNQGGSTCILNSDYVNGGGETLTESTADNIEGKVLLMFPTLDEHVIESYDTSTRTVTLAQGDTWSSDDLSSSHVRIVDARATDYVLKVIEMV
tara:strand:- start:3795 stop:4073 length:279 start_codon:yes stop_codon:yes gene_type:complete